MALPRKVKYVIIGAGVHGLSTAWHLAKKLEAWRRGSGEDIVVLDKTTIALHLFRFSRFAEGALHPTSNSPYPWN